MINKIILVINIATILALISFDNGTLNEKISLYKIKIVIQIDKEMKH